QGLVAPAAIPQAVIARLQRELIAIPKLPDLRDKLAAQEKFPGGSTAQEVAPLLARELVQSAEGAREGHRQITQRGPGPSPPARRKKRAWRRGGGGRQAQSTRPAAGGTAIGLGMPVSRAWSRKVQRQSVRRKYQSARSIAGICNMILRADCGISML